MGRGPRASSWSARYWRSAPTTGRSPHRSRRSSSNLARFQVSTRSLAHDVAVRLRERVDGGEDGSAVLATVAAEMAMAGESAARVAELAVRVLERPLDPAESMGDYSFLIAVRSLIVADELELATRTLDEAVDAAAHRGAAFGLRFLMVFRSDAAYRRGALFDAEADARIGYDLALENEWLIGVPASVAHLVFALIERGELGEAARVVEEAGLGGPAAGASGPLHDASPAARPRAPSHRRRRAGGRSRRSTRVRAAPDRDRRVESVGHPLAF